MKWAYNREQMGLYLDMFGSIPRCSQNHQKITNDAISRIVFSASHANKGYQKIVRKRKDVENV